MSVDDRSGGALRRSSIFAAVDVVGKLVALVAVAVVARHLDAAEFGAVLTSLAGATILSLIVDCGINQRLVAVVVADASGARAIATRRYQVVVPAALAVLIASQLAPGLRLYGLAATAGLMVSLLPVGALLADDRITAAAASLSGPNLIFLAYLLARGPSSAAETVGAWAAANAAIVLGLSLTISWLRPVRTPGVSLHDVVRESFPLGIANIVGAAYGRVDILLVAAIIDTNAAGAYAANYRIVLALVGLAAWTSNIEARRLGDPEFTVATLHLLVRWAVVTAVSVCLLLAISLPLIMRTLLSPAQELSRVTSVLLALLVLPHIVAMPVTQLVILRHRQRELARAAIIVGALAVVLYPVFIVTWGVNGAASASLLLDTLAFALIGMIVSRILAVEKSPTDSNAPEPTES